MSALAQEKGMSISIEKLEKYADLDGTAFGSYVSNLVEIFNYNECHGMSPEFRCALLKEMDYILERFEKETRIERHRVPQPDRIVEELVWIDE